MQIFLNIKIVIYITMILISRTIINLPAFKEGKDERKMPLQP